MKQTLLFISALILLSGCGLKTAKPVANDESSTPGDTKVSMLDSPAIFKDLTVKKVRLAEVAGGDGYGQIL